MRMNPASIPSGRPAAPLRYRTLLTVGLVFVLLAAGVGCFSWFIVMRSFLGIEQDVATRNVERGVDALSAELNALDSKAGDWANWDDAYRFAQDGNPEFIKVNCTATTFLELQIDLLAFIDPTGRVVYAQGWDLESDRAVEVPADLSQHTRKDALLLRHRREKSSVTGIVKLSQGAMLVASRPILDSEGKGPIRGTLLFGHWLGEAQVRDLSERTHQAMQVHSLDGAGDPAVQQSIVQLTGGARVAVTPLDANTVAGYTFLWDVYGQPAFVLEVRMDRAVVAQGRATILYFVISLLVVGLLSGLLLALLLERWILSRVAALNASVVGIGRHGDLSMRIAERGQDEISSLTHEINGMLESLQQSGKELRRHRDRLEELVKERTQSLQQSNEKLQEEISERRRAEEKIAASLKEKDALLQEVHHRVKNNLQIIVSMLHLQADQSLAREVKDALQRGQDRVQSMALIYAALYHSRDLAHVDMKEYLGRLTNSLVQSYRKDPAGVKLELEVDALSLEPAKATPCGLIVSELLSNALLHAFPDGRTGKICVALGRRDDGRLRLVVRDDGVGLPKGIVFPGASTLGLQLVEALASQLDGTLACRRDLGSEFEVVFAVPAERKEGGGV